MYAYVTLHLACVFPHTSDHDGAPCQSKALQRYLKGAAGVPQGYWTILHDAAAFGQPTIMKYALVVEKSGVQPGPGGISPLHVAVTHGWQQLVSMLIEKGMHTYTLPPF